MLKQAALIVIASFVLFLICRYVIYRRPITAEDARKVYLAIIFSALGIYAIFDFFKF